jgi:hypothetical protein
MTKSPLTDTQLVILSAAAQREDLRIELPERLRGGAAKAVLSTLLGKSLIELDPNLEHERATPDSESLEGSAYRISLEGLAAIGIESDAEDGLVQGDMDECAAESDQSAVMPVKAGAPSASPRAGTKLAEVIGLLERGEGASIDELTALTGWLSHTTRAALTGLRKRGVVIERAKRDDGTTFYRIAPTTSADTAGEVV